MEVLNAVIHKVEKQANAGDARLVPAATQLQIDDTVKRVSEQIRGLYRTGVVYGVFESNDEVYRFQPNLRDCFSGAWDGFFAFSVTALGLLKARMDEKSASVGAYVMFLHYRELNEDFLFVVMMKDEIGASVNKDLTIKDSIHLELSKLHVAARININKWEAAENNANDHKKYVSFIRGRREVSDYFVAFIGCTEITRPRESTTNLINALNDYAADSEMSSDQKDRQREVAAVYLSGCVEDDKEASLSTLSTLLNEDDPEAFQDYLVDGGYELSSHFKVDKPCLSRLKSVRFTSKKLNIRMTEEFVKSSVALGTDNTSMTIADLPEALVREIKSVL